MKKSLWAKSLNVIPGGNTLISKRPNLWLPKTWPSHFIKADGIKVTSVDKKIYKDFLFAVGTNTLGYSNKEVNGAVVNAIKNGNMSSLNCHEEYLLAEKLVDINKWADMVKFTRGGGEAMSIAARIARAASGKENIAFCGYHGWHDWYVSSNLGKKKVLDDYVMTGIKSDGVPESLRNTIFPFKYNDLERLKILIQHNDVGTIIMEVKRNIDPENSFLEKVRKLCNQKNIVLVFDECSTGFRQNYGGLHQDYNVIPDIVMYGKAIGNGFAIAAIVGKKAVMECANNSFISSSFWGERVGFVAALKTLEIMKKTKSYNLIKKNGKYIISQLKRIAKENNVGIDIIGIPSIPTFVFKNLKNNLFYKTLIAQEMIKKNMLCSTIFFLSSKHKIKDLDDYLFELNKVFKIISKCENGERIKKYLKHSVVDSTFKRLN
jgi:glutamate-1-semialdehyde 2,1-aminomutase